MTLTHAQRMELLAHECEDLVWVVDTTPPDRWRSYLTYDVRCSPEAFRTRCERRHQDFLDQRNRTARSAVQLTRLAQMAEPVCEPDVVDTLLFHTQFALLELRAAELQLVGYQLVLGTLGFRTRERDLLFLATHHAYELLVLLWRTADEYSDLVSSAADRKALRDDRPLRVESPRYHARALTDFIHQLQVFADADSRLGRVWTLVTPIDVSFARAHHLLERWGALVRALDKVVLVDPAPTPIPDPVSVPAHPARPPNAPTSHDAADGEAPVRSDGGLEETEKPR